MSALKRAQIHVTGIVQGVGFRPFVYNLAVRLGIFGWVQNTSAGVDIEIDGPEQTIDQFIQLIRDEAPPLAKIDQVEVAYAPPNGYTTFEIIHSAPIAEAFQPISPDVAICPDCLHELFNPDDRRYRYPFINCTNCGPRFTIITDIPYDRPNTTMAGFGMCPECAEEYANPQDRRFHAQPIACPHCGPHIWLEMGGKQIAEADEAIIESQRMLTLGKILAIKGLGGFHLACDAESQTAVSMLRQRKLRVDKPFALMMADMETVHLNCFVNDAEQVLLESYQRPIVILKRRSASRISSEVAPNQDTIGVMLPYTPLHYLLFAATQPRPPGINSVGSSLAIPKALVMTSGNLSEEPIAFDNEEARERLSTLADAFLMHNRPIHTRCDDSVVRTIVEGHRSQAKPRHELESPFRIYSLRRSRGYAPTPIDLPWDAPSILAVGTELKNTFCLTRDHYAFLSHHIGDMENYETLRSFEEGVAHYQQLYRIQPEALAYDFHPNYLATRYALTRAQEEGLASIGIQHHHAHITACMADNLLPLEEMVIGVAFDGTGYGDDGAIWGGEFMLAGYLGYKRLAHLAYIPLPGGDMATRKPARIALAQLWHAGLEWERDLLPVQSLSIDEITSLRSQLAHKVNTPLTTSMGRLFDGIAALTGVRQTVNYEAQAAIEFEALVDLNERNAYPFDYATDISEEDNLSTTLIEPSPLFQAVVMDLHAGTPVSIIAARFHNGIAEMVRNVVMSIRNSSGINSVVLSGGVWQNLTLLHETCNRLEQSKFNVILHHLVPTNDGGLSLGQASIAAANLIHAGINKP